MRLKLTFFLAILISSFSLAQKINYTAFDKIKREAKSDSVDIRVFSSPSLISFKYREIGLMTVDDRGWGKSENKLLEKALDEARRRGGDGILMLDQDNKVDGYMYGMAFNRKVLRIAVIIKEE